MIFLPAFLCGRDLISWESQCLINGLHAVHIMELLTWRDFPKMFIISTRVNGQTNPCCTFSRIGTGSPAKRLMFGLITTRPMRLNFLSMEDHWASEKKIPVV